MPGKLTTMKQQKIMSTADEPNLLIVAPSEIDANLYYATRFIAPDDFVFARIRGKKYMLMSDLEVDRARSQASVDEVVSISKLRTDYEKKYARKPGYLDLGQDFLKCRGAIHLLVPANFPISYADTLRKRGFIIAFKNEPFFEERTVKTNAEIEAIRKAIGFVEEAVHGAITVLKKSIIKRGKLYFQGKVLTSEALKRVIDVKLMERGCIANHSIV